MAVTDEVMKYVQGELQAREDKILQIALRGGDFVVATSLPR